MSDQTSELLPCPKCNEGVVMGPMKDEDDRRYWCRTIECDCGVTFKEGIGWLEYAKDRNTASDRIGEMVARMWNTRATTETAAAVTAALRAAADIADQWATSLQRQYGNGVPASKITALITPSGTAALDAAIARAVAEKDAEIARLRAGVAKADEVLTEAEAILGGEYGDHYSSLCEMMLDLRSQIAALDMPLEGGAL